LIASELAVVTPSNPEAAVLRFRCGNDGAIRVGPEESGSNLKRHGISCEEAVGVFGDPLARIFDDEDFAVGERREIIIGHSTRNRLLLICFIEREDVRRIISDRKATRNERKDYEEGITP